VVGAVDGVGQGVGDFLPIQVVNQFEHIPAGLLKVSVLGFCDVPNQHVKLAAILRKVGGELLADEYIFQVGDLHPERGSIDDVTLWIDLTQAQELLNQPGRISLMMALECACAWADLPKVRTPWEHLLRTLLTRGLSRSPDRSWSRPSRSYLANQGRGPNGQRLPWEPGVTASKSVPRLVVMVDVSGSIDDALLERFAREIEAISRRLEAGLTIIVGDDRVGAVDHFEPGRSNLRDIQFRGGGGTDFTPLLREAERHAPDIGVFLTDLDGPANHHPAWPLLWAVPVADAHRPHPFGRKLVLE